MLNKRCAKILFNLLERDKVIKIDELADKFNVSNRTIRYDLDKIDYFLKENDFNKIIRRQNAGVIYKTNKYDKKKLYEIFNKLDFQEYVLCQKERVVIILYELLNSKLNVNYEMLINKLKISKSTLVSDMRLVRQWLEKYNIEVINGKRNGIIFKGEEVDIRKATVDLLINYKNKYNIIETLNGIYEKENKVIYEDLKYLSFSNEKIKFMENIIKKLEKNLNFVLSDQDFDKLTINTLVTINRVLMKKKIECDVSYDIEIMSKNEIRVIIDFIEEIEKNFKVKLDEFERKYLIIQILASSADDFNILEGINYYEIEYITNELITNVEKVLKMNLRTDVSLYQGILKHMKSALFRIKIGINTRNAILDNIKESYNQLFNIIKECSKFIEVKYSKKISEDEIGYLTLYLQSAIERTKRKNNNNKTNVLIACSTGFATGRLLSCKLSEKFDANIVGVTSVHNINEFINKKIVDIIISTVPVESDIAIPHIVVTPLLSEEDLNKIRYYLKDANFTCDNKFIGDIFKIIDENCEIKNMDKLKKDLNNYFSIKEKKTKNISKFIELDCINLNIDVKDWRETIKKSAIPLMNKGVINKNYIKNMIENIETLGPYIVIDEGIAMPHAKPGQNVKGFGITLTTLKYPIDIYDRKGIKIFITLATEDEKSHVNIMMQIMRLIEDEEFIKILNTCNDKNIVYAYIMKKIQLVY